MKTLAIVPAFNEEYNLPEVINDLKTHCPYIDILIVNDGSTDNTSDVARLLGAVVIDLPYNLGIGGAIQTGFLYALNQGYDFAVQFDGDAQHRADELAKILDPVINGEADLAVGSRFRERRTYRQTFMRMAGIRVFAFVLTRITGIKLTDTTSGFRAYGQNAIEAFAGYYPEDYPEVEAIVLLHRLGLRIVEVQVEMKSRRRGISSINATRAVYYMIKVLLAVFMRVIGGVRTNIE